MTRWMVRFFSCTSVLIPFALVLSLSASALAVEIAQEPSSAASKLQHVRDIKQFQVGVPAGWSRYNPGMGLSPEEKGVFDVVMFGPESVDGIRSEIRVAYYAPGNLVCKSAEKYIQLHAQPVFGSPSPGEIYSKVEEERIGGRTAWAFGRDRYEYLPPETLTPKKIPVYQRYKVISAREGFFVLHCSAGLDRKSMVLEQFAAVLASFKPLVQ